MAKEFTPEQRRSYYAAIVKGKIPVKTDSKYTPAEQIAYAKGQLVARIDLSGKSTSKSASKPKVDREHNSDDGHFFIN